MFEENENIYPVKPELLKGTSRKNAVYLILLLIALMSVIVDYNLNTYIVLFEVLFVLFLHELGHFFMMKYFKVQAQGMFFMSFLGRQIKSLRLSDSQKEQTLINLMGPLPGILIGVGLFLVVENGFNNYYLLELSYIFIAINLLNLVPIDPFDGGRIIGGFFFCKNDQYRMVFTLISSLAFIGVGVYFQFVPLMIFGFLMGLKVRSLQKSQELHENLEETNVNYKKTYEDLTDREYWKIRKAFLKKNPKLEEMIPSGYTLWENERLLVEQVRQILRIKTKPDLSVLAKFGILIIMAALVVVPAYLLYQNREIFDWYLDRTNA